MLDFRTLEILLNFPYLQVSSAELEKSTLHIYCHSLLEETICPNCLKKLSEVKKRTVRTLRDLPIVGKVVQLHLESRQFYCPDCNCYVNENFSFVESSKTMTKRYEKYVYECCRNSSVERVSLQENIVWDSVQNIGSLTVFVDLARNS